MARTGILGREVLAVDLVHDREVGHVHEEDRAAHDVAVVEPDGTEQLPDVVEHLAGLGGGTARHHLAARWRTDLAREEHEAVGLDHRGEGQPPGLEARDLRHGLGHRPPPLV